jgi:large subunit ribosomal protein L13
MINKTTMPQKNTVQHTWHFIDAQDQTLGRLAARVAKILTGKHKAIFTPNINVGDKVVITNADKFVVTGKKMKDKTYIWYTGFPKGLRSQRLEERLEKNPTKILEGAIKGMLPNNKLRNVRMKNLFIYTGSEHPHKVQGKTSVQK